MPSPDAKSEASSNLFRWTLARWICEALCVLFLVGLILLTVQYFVKLRPMWAEAKQASASASTEVAPGTAQSANASAVVAPGASPGSASASASCSVVPPHSKGKTTPAPCPACCASPCCGSASNVDVSAAMKLQIQIEVGIAQKKLEENAEKLDADKRAVLNQLITLIAGYAAILGLTAFITLGETRRRARDQLDDEVKQNQERLKVLAADQAKTLEAFNERLADELPELQNLGDRLRELFLYLNRLIPPEIDWTLETTYAQISERVRQEVLISEATIGALPLIVSMRTSEMRHAMASLYQGLARFYFTRYQGEKQLGDAERAQVYLSKSLASERNSSGYALRGAFTLGIVAEETTGVLEQRQLLESAEGDLRAALNLNPKNIGAAYNLALAVYQMERPNAPQKHFDDAIRASIDGIQAMTSATREEVSNKTIRKYGGALYSNLACYLAKKAEETDATAADGLQRRSVEQIRAGAAFLNKADFSPAFSDLKRNVQRELLPNGDLSLLDNGLKDEIRKILDAPEL